MQKKYYIVNSVKMYFSISTQTFCSKIAGYLVFGFQISRTILDGLVYRVKLSALY